MVLVGSPYTRDIKGLWGDWGFARLGPLNGSYWLAVGLWGGWGFARRGALHGSWWLADGLWGRWGFARRDFFARFLVASPLGSEAGEALHRVFCCMVLAGSPSGSRTPHIYIFFVFVNAHGQSTAMFRAMCTAR